MWVVVATVNSEELGGQNEVLKHHKPVRLYRIDTQRAAHVAMELDIAIGPTKTNYAYKRAVVASLVSVERSCHKRK